MTEAFLPNFQTRTEGVAAEMIWTDTETTGLDHEGDALLEVGVIVTDLDGNEAATYRSLVIEPNWRMKLINAHAMVKEMHENNGLRRDLSDLVDALDSSPRGSAYVQFSSRRVDEHLREWLLGFGESQKFPMCGSTINFDRGVYDHHLQNSLSWFHYRNIDVSSLKNLCRMLNPDLYARLPQVPKEEKAHRVLDDIRASIEEYKFYKDNFLFVA